MLALALYFSDLHILLWITFYMLHNTQKEFYKFTAARYGQKCFFKQQKKSLSRVVVIRACGVKCTLQSKCACSYQLYSKHSHIYMSSSLIADVQCRFSGLLYCFALKKKAYYILLYWIMNMAYWHYPCLWDDIQMIEYTIFYMDADFSLYFHILWHIEIRDFQ